jgi:DNA-binding MarR family transcriptional regulator
MAAMPLNEFADKLGLILPKIMREFGRRHQNELMRGLISLPQFIIMDYLGDEGPVCMTDLARFGGVSMAAMTGIVARLVRSGYVCRQADPKDRRIIKVCLTMKGQKAVKKVHEERRHVILDVFGKISEMEREDYLRILLRIKEVVTREKDIAS